MAGGNFGQGGNFVWRQHPAVVNKLPIRWFPGFAFGASAFALVFVYDKFFSAPDPHHGHGHGHGAHGAHGGHGKKAAHKPKAKKEESSNLPYQFTVGGAPSFPDDS